MSITTSSPHLRRGRLARSAAATLLATALVASGAVAASAASGTPERSAVRNPDGSVTIEVPAERVERWCTETGPRRLDRAERLTERVGADASTAGSAAWVREWAAQAQAAGRVDRAERLLERADRMERTADNVDERSARASERAAQLCSDGSGS